MAPPPGLFKIYTEAENQAIKDFLEHAFQRTEMIYKTLRGVSFPVAVLVPKTVASALPRKSPVLVHWHGGGLVVGEPVGLPMIARWVLELAAQQGAVLVSPTYRLVPEANGSDIIEDVQDFWTWTRRILPSAVSSVYPGLEVELDHLAVTGESAGGFLSLQSAALSDDMNIKVVIAQYPGMDPAHPAYNARPAHVNREDDAFVTDYINSLEPGTIRISSPFPERLDLMLAMLRTGRHREMIGNDKRMRLGDLLREGKTTAPYLDRAGC